MNYDMHNYQVEPDYTRNLHEKCRKYMYYHVTIKMSDGRSFDGIIEDVGSDHINVLVGEDVAEQENDGQEYRQYFGYGRPRRRFRRFRRQQIPLALLLALSLLPYPSPYPYYPYY